MRDTSKAECSSGEYDPCILKGVSVKEVRRVAVPRENLDLAEGYCIGNAKLRLLYSRSMREQLNLGQYIGCSRFSTDMRRTILRASGRVRHNVGANSQ